MWVGLVFADIPSPLRKIQNTKIAQKSCPEEVWVPRLRNQSEKRMWGRSPHSFSIAQFRPPRPPPDTNFAQFRYCIICLFMYWPTWRSGLLQPKSLDVSIDSFWLIVLLVWFVQAGLGPIWAVSLSRTDQKPIRNWPGRRLGQFGAGFLIRPQCTYCRKKGPKPARR